MRALTLYNLIALAACGALAAWIQQETQRPMPALPEGPEISAVIQTAAGPTSAAPPPTFRLPPKNTYVQLVSRPPFSPSRHPPRAKPTPAPEPVALTPQPAAPAAVAEPQAILVGIVINAGKSIAMVRKPGAEELLRLAKGAELDGWLVEGVLPDRLVLSHGDKLLELELTEGAQNGGGSSAAEPPQAPTRPRRQ
jgi:general secretion pathway protein N